MKGPDANAPCPYGACLRAAIDVDDEGEAACPYHAALSRSYEIVADLDEGTWASEPLAARIESRLEDEGWTVLIRRPRRGEILGTYEETSNGLRLANPIPEDLRLAVEGAWNWAVGG